MMTIRIMGLTLAAAALALSACGQSGPLYLPGNPGRVQVENPEQDSRESADDEAEADAEDETRD
jgi:predicted small lipoprotein YifL